MHHAVAHARKEIYKTSGQLGKRDRFGIWAEVESLSLRCMALAIEAAFSSLPEKLAALKSLRIQADILKRLIRLCQELSIIEERKYFSLQEKLVETSKMAHGWLAYAERKPRP